MVKNLFILLFTALILTSTAQDADPFADTLDAPEVANIETEVTEESVAKGLKIDWPIKDPDKSVEQIKKETEELIESKLKDQFPPKTLEDFKAELEKKFLIHKIGDEVSVDYKFRNATQTAKGKYKKLSSKTLEIGGTPIPVVDIKESRLVSFDMDLRKKYIHRVANKKFYDFNTDREILSEKLVKMYKSSPYKKAGFIFSDSKWQKPSVVVKAAYESKMAAITKKKKKEEEEAKKFKLLSKSEDGTVEKILGQDPQHVYIGAGILIVLILGAAVMKK